MKKYRVKYKCDVTGLGYYSSKEEAEDKLMEYLKDIDDDDEGYFSSPSNYVIDEVELSPNDLIPDFESAKRYLKLEGSNEKNIEALIALDQLFTIAEAWNKEDGFVPNFSNWSQEKWAPVFLYNRFDDMFVYDYADCTTAHSLVTLCSRLCFKTEERAKQFGMKFSDLYNKVFLINK